MVCSPTGLTRGETAFRYTVDGWNSFQGNFLCYVKSSADGSALMVTARITYSCGGHL